VSQIGDRMRYAIVNLLEKVDGGVRLSELTTQEQRLCKFCARRGYIVESPIKGDWIIEATGKRP
jgi:hypothetical protein